MPVTTRWQPDDRAEHLASETIAETYESIVSRFHRDTTKRVRRGATTRVGQQAAVRQVEELAAQLGADFSGQLVERLGSLLTEQHESLPAEATDWRTTNKRIDRLAKELQGASSRSEARTRCVGRRPYPSCPSHHTCTAPARATHGVDRTRGVTCA